MKKNSIIDKTLSETVATSTGAVAGMMIGSKVGLPEFGAYVGAVITPAINNVAMALLTPRQLKRIEIVSNLAKTKIQIRLQNGEKIRNDVTKEDLQELSEGSLITARDSYEEKKIPLLANLVANAAFTKLPLGNLMSVLNMADLLSYRQICVLGAVGKNMIAGRKNFIIQEIKDFFIDGSDHLTNGIFQDVMLLQEYGLIEQSEGGPDPSKVDPALAMGNIIPNRLKLGYLGGQLFNLMELIKVDCETMREVLSILDGTHQR